MFMERLFSAVIMVFAATYWHQSLTLWGKKRQKTNLIKQQKT